MLNKTVMFITNNGGGLYSFRYELIKELINREFTVKLVYPCSVWKKEFEKIGCECIDLPFDSSSTNPIRDIKLFWRLNSLIRKHRPNIALLYTIKPCIYAGAILRMRHIPYIATVTGISPALISNNAYVRVITKYLSRIGYGGASVVYFQNKMNEELFTNLNIAHKEYMIIPGSGVNLEKFKFIEYPKDDKSIKLLYLGRLKKIKGLEELAYAVRKIKETGINVICKAVGESGDELPQFNSAVHDRLIQYEGATNNVLKYIAWCDALVLPSYGEGMSNVLQEASASGRPVLASNIPGCKEVFEQGITGYGFEAKSGDSLFQAIKAFSEISYVQRKQMGKNARAKMEKEFDRKKIVNMYYSEIEQLLREGKS